MRTVTGSSICNMCILLYQMRRNINTDTGQVTEGEAHAQVGEAVLGTNDNAANKLLLNQVDVENIQKNTLISKVSISLILL